ncbi:MAG TPA: hypothetical protein VHL34_23875 [Rhizomicrobium sp.]|jgi:hypothetical protein|nr:hypothetical protein [Rhizomicrobium sp.]
MANNNLPRINNVKALQPYDLEIIWVDGTRSSVDLTALFGRLRIFQPLITDPSLFRKVEVVNSQTALRWNGSNDMEYPASALHNLGRTQEPPQSA